MFWTFDSVLRVFIRRIDHLNFRGCCWRCWSLCTLVRGFPVFLKLVCGNVPTIYLQLKRSHKSPNSSSLTFNPPSTSFPTPSHDNNNHPHSIVTNGNQHTEIHQPIRRSHRLQQRQQQRENSKDQSFRWRLEVPSRKLKTNNYNPENTV